MKQIRKYEAALIQMDTQNDKGENLKKARRFIEEAAAHGAKLICFPEVMNLIGKNTGEGGAGRKFPAILQRSCVRRRKSTEFTSMRAASQSRCPGRSDPEI